METQLTEETLQAVEDCGAAEMPLAETLEIAELTENDWNRHPEAGRRYKKGQLKTKLAIRQAVVKGARSGNPAMLKAYFELFTVQDEHETAHILTESGPKPASACQEKGEFDDI